MQVEPILLRPDSDHVWATVLGLSYPTSAIPSPAHPPVRPAQLQGTPDPLAVSHSNGAVTSPDLKDSMTATLPPAAGTPASKAGAPLPKGTTESSATGTGPATPAQLTSGTPGGRRCRQCGGTGHNAKNCQVAMDAAAVRPARAVREAAARARSQLATVCVEEARDAVSDVLDR